MKKKAGTHSEQHSLQQNLRETDSIVGKSDSLQQRAIEMFEQQKRDLEGFNLTSEEGDHEPFVIP